MRCGGCQYENPIGARFCQECGGRLAVACGGCGAEVAPGLSTCPRCGRPRDAAHEEPSSSPTSLAPTAERRQITVLFCDLVNSTEFASRMDVEDWRELVQRYQDTCADVVARFEGHVAQYLGDGLLVYFGFPHAHEDDAERAVRAGLDMQRAVAELNEHLAREGERPLAVRIGIHTGPVVVGEMGSGTRREHLALGETANLAARLQGTAEAGTVHLSDATLRLVQGRFVTRDLGVRELRGIAEPPRVHAALRPGDPGGRPGAASDRELGPFVGREAELRRLEVARNGLREGRGRVVLVSGEPGIGKSRLLTAFRERLEPDSHTWSECRGSPYARGSAFYPVIELHRRAFGFRIEDAADAKLARLESALREAGIEPARALPLLAALHSLPAPSPVETNAEIRRDRTLTLLTDWLLRMGSTRPAILVVEDLHWVDPSTLELLGRLVERVAEAPVLLLLTFRPGFTPPWEARPWMDHLSLSRLDRSELRDLIRSLAAGRDLSPSTLEEIAARSDGVPLFAEELTKAVFESARSDPDGTPRPQRIPVTLQDSLTARLDALGAARELAQVASVLGRRFESAHLEALYAPDPLPTAWLEQLEQAGLLQRRVRPAVSYAFKHALIRDAAYESLLRSTRRALHRQVADVLEERFAETAEQQPELVAHHREEAGQLESAIRCWRRAGERALSGSAYLEAASHFQRALRLLGMLPASLERTRTELDLQLPLGLAVIATRGYSAPEVAEIFRRAQILCEEIGDTPLPVLYGIWVVHLVRGDLEATDGLVPLLERYTLPGRHRHHLLIAHTALGCRDFYLGRHAQARRHVRIAIENYDAAEHAEVARVYGGDGGINCHLYLLWTLWISGLPDQAMSAYERAIELAERTGDPLAIAGTLSFGVALHQHCRRVSEVEHIAERLERLCVERHLPFYLAMGTCAKGWVAAQRDELDAGLAKLDRGLAILEATGARTSSPYWRSLRVEAHLRGGQLEEGLRVVDEALAVSKQTLDRFYAPELHRLRGELRRRGGSGQEALSLFQQALAEARDDGARSLELRAATSLFRLWRDRGEGGRGREILSEAYASFTEGFGTGDLLEARALLEGGS